MECNCDSLFQINNECALTVASNAEICKLLVIPERIWKFLSGEDLEDKENKCKYLMI